MKDHFWWQSGVLYQVYPRSFYDSDNDGTGDLRGIAQKLDYLLWLGVEGIWISPFYPSPMDDFGYDITDYTGIDPVFGSMNDFDFLLEEAHKRNIKIIIDLVPNHTSYLHPWFQESRASKDNPKRDWYIWKDPSPDGGAPTNWQSVFGGSGWEYDESTGQYYYHAFLKEQPDLNWRNNEVKEAMLNVMKFWLDKGIDGFRVDVIWHMIKDELYRDNPPNPDYKDGEPDYTRFINTYSEDQPMVHDIIADMKILMQKYDKKLLIGEIYLPLDRLMTYYGKEGAGVDLPFNFQLIKVDWTAKKIYALVNDYEGSLPADGWPNWVLSNHDKSRVSSRIGEERAKIAAFLLLTFRGTPTIYFGDEIGMTDVPIPEDQIRDPKNKTMPGYTRDPQRTPMQWNNTENAGFSSVEPWLPVSQDYKKINIENQKKDNDSILNFYRDLIHLRKKEVPLAIGEFMPVGVQGHVMIYKRQYQGSQLLCLVNFESEDLNYIAPEKEEGEILLCSTRTREGDWYNGEIFVEGFEAIIIKIRIENNVKDAL